MAFLLAVPLWSALFPTAAAPVVINASVAGMAAIATVGAAFGGLLRGAFEARRTRVNQLLREPIIAPPAPLDTQARFFEVTLANSLVFIIMAAVLSAFLLMLIVACCTKALDFFIRKQRQC